MKNLLISIYRDLLLTSNCLYIPQTSTSILTTWQDFLKPCNLQNGQSYRRLDPIKPFIPLVAPVFWNTGILSHVKINATETRRVFICSWIKFCNFVLDTVLGQSMEKKLYNYVETKILNMDMKFIFRKKKKKLQIHKIRKCLLVYVYESVIFILTFNLLLVHGKEHGVTSTLG